MPRPRTEALMKRAQTLAAKGDKSMIELAAALSELRTLPKLHGDRPTLYDLADLTKLSRRKICYLLKVWQTFGDLGIPRDRLASTGWTKLAILAENCELGEVREALELVDTYTAKELLALLKGQRHKLRPAQCSSA